MRNRIILMVALLLVVAGVSAQKVDQRLTRLVEKVNTRRAQGGHVVSAEGMSKTMAMVLNDDGSIKALSAIARLEDGAECPTAQLEQMGIEVRYIMGGQVALLIPADKLTALEQVEEFRYVKPDLMRETTNRVARTETKADISGDATQAVANGLPQAYTGKGVVLGIVDKGIDFNHAAFRNADGTTRVKRAYVYGITQYWAYDDTTIGTLLSDTYSSSHGTHTAATAGGSETGNGQQGVAPETDLVLCGLAENLSTTNINHAIGKIFEYADEVNKPCVVSLSIGSTLGLHDGSDETCSLIASLTENGTKPGRAVLISSSNAADNWESLVKKLDDTSTELKTVLGAATAPTTNKPDNAVTYNINYCFYADDYQDFDIQLKVVNTKNGALSDIGSQVVYLSDGTVCNVKLDKTLEKTAKGGSAVVYSLLFQSEPVKMTNSDERLALVVKAKKAGQTIKLMCRGDNNYEPCFDAPHDPGCYDFAANGYTLGSGDFACNTMVCDDAVISVGSYITTTQWVDYQGNTRAYRPSLLTGKEQVVGEISDFSSYCIDDNGKPRPTIIAPGMGIISACNNWDEEFFKVNINGQNDEPGTPDEDNAAKTNMLRTLINYVDKNNRKNWYALEQGTSMSCPHAAGIVALWMQANPTLTTNDILSVMKNTCVNDEFTTNPAMIPSGNKVQAGWGKIDCLAGLKEILGTTGIETISMDGHREATPSTMYSVDAPVYNMMGQRVDKSQKGLVIYKGRKYVNK